MYTLKKKQDKPEIHEVVVGNTVVGSTAYVDGAGNGSWATKIGLYEFKSTNRKKSVEGCLRKVIICNT